MHLTASAAAGVRRRRSWDAGAMNLANIAVSPGTQGLVVALVALQQANGIDVETALGRVRATAESGSLLVADIGWAELEAMIRWFATPPPPPPPASQPPASPPPPS